MNSNVVIPNIEALPEESRLVSQAKSGDADAFVKLYDAYVEDVYRYIYFRVINDAATEDITSQVFRHAWKDLKRYPTDGSSFITWIFEIANNLVLDYYKTNLKTHAIDVDFLSVPADYGLKKEVQDLIKLEVMRNHLRFLVADQQPNPISKYFYNWTINRNITRIISGLECDIHTLQVSTLQTVAKFLEYLNLGREVKPSPTFNARTRLWLAQYLKFHARRPQRSSLFWRMSLTYAVLIAALLVTGTAKAQSALPGDILYGWKRTSEQAWRSLSPDPVGTDIFLANRRLSEWIAVQNDPARSANASDDYFDELANLQSTGNAQTRARILPVLKIHRQRLNDSGISTTQLDNYLTVGANPAPTVTTIQVLPAENVTTANMSNEVAAPAKDTPNNVIPPATEVATGATDVLSAVSPAATDIPTVVAVASTDVSTAAAPAATNGPTAAAPTAATDVPSAVAPAATDVPSAVAPAATDVPAVTAPPATDVPAVTAPPASAVPAVVAPPATDVPSGSANPVAPAPSSPQPIPPVTTP
jgi:RNA polymerase sigma factor (sigma-70 family)